MKKLNVIDFLVIFVIVAIIVFVAYKLLAPAPTTGVDAPNLSVPNCRITVQSDDVSMELAQSMKACLNGEPRNVHGVQASPCHVFNSDKLLDAQVVDIIILGEGDFVSVRFVIEANVDLSAPTYMLGRQEVRMGGDYLLKTVDFTSQTIVVALEKLL